MKILPSIAAGDLMNLAMEVKKLEDAGADGIHFDVMDGHFVPLLTIGIPFIQQMKKVTGLPLDVHIMVTNPDTVFQDYLDAGSDTLTFHAETAMHSCRVISAIQNAGKKAGVALNPGTSFEAVRELLWTVDQVTVMTVSPGFSRQAHLSFVHTKIEQLSNFKTQNNLEFEIQVDGGINPDNIKSIADCGATAVVAGGAIFQGVDYKKNLEKLRNAL